MLGIDPGLRKTGFGIVEYHNYKFKYITSGVITTIGKNNRLDYRLKIILDSLTTIIKQYQPKFACIEKVFVNMNPNATLLLGQARGAILANCIMNQLEIAEYTALQIKKSVVGYGHADKTQVARMVCHLLSLDGELQPDSADALASAITHLFHLKTKIL